MLIASSDVGLTGFLTPQGHFHWRFMPFGLRNSPATFSRLVTKVFKGLEEVCEAYLDDIMVFSRSWEAHMSHLHKVFKMMMMIYSFFIRNLVDQPQLKIQLENSSNENKMKIRKMQECSGNNRPS